MSRPRTLSHRIEAIEYVHADDGQPYRHDFTRGDSDIALRKDGSVIIRNTKGKQLWDLFDVDGVQQPFLINPARNARSTRRKAVAKKKRKMSALQARYFGKKKRNAPRRKRSVSVHAAPATRRGRRNPAAKVRTHRRRRRNPPMFSIQGLIRQATQGVVDGALVVGGRVIARLASAQFEYTDGSMMDTFVEVGTALALGFIGPKVVGLDRTRFLMAGAFSSPIETLVHQANIPHISPLLSGGPFPVSTSMWLNAADAATIQSGGMGRRLRGYGPRNGAPLSAGVELAKLSGYSRQPTPSVLNS